MANACWFLLPSWAVQMYKISLKIVYFNADLIYNKEIVYTKGEYTKI